MRADVSAVSLQGNQLGLAGHKEPLGPCPLWVGWGCHTTQSMASGAFLWKDKQRVTRHTPNPHIYIQTLLHVLIPARLEEVEGCLLLSGGRRAHPCSEQGAGGQGNECG